VPRLTLLLPPASKFAGIALPAALAKALGRADRNMHEAGGQAQLSRHFRLPPNRWSEAALSRVADTDEADARTSGWLRADPAYIRPDINGARLLGIGDALGIAQADVDAFLPTLRPLFGDAGCVLDAPTPSRWYLRLPHEARLPVFASPDEALGDDVFEHIPDGPEARRWRVLSSEAQVMLHNHPRNAERIAAGKPPVNSLWFWGGGIVPDQIRPDGIASDSPTVYSDDVRLHGIARIGKLDAMPMRAYANPEHDALVDLRAARDPRAVVESWLVPIAASAHGRDVAFDFADGQVFALRASQRWRVWRRPRAKFTA
jgi:hypothetical protein